MGSIGIESLARIRGSRMHSTSLRPRRRLRRAALEGLECRRLLAVVSDNIQTDTLWTIAESPYEVTREITVDSDSTLTIEPGVTIQFQPDARLRVRGRLVAEGDADNRIRMEPVTGQSIWGGLKFDETNTDNRVTFTDMDAGYGQGEAIDIDHSRVFLDHLRWTRTNDTILELKHPSLIVRNSKFPPTNRGEVIHGSQLSGNEYLVIQGNQFGNSNNGNDVVDFLGADRPGPIMQVLDNVFLGGGDDGLDLDGTDAHIEGNVFMNFRKNTGRNTTSNAIATGLPQNGADNRTEITVVRNLFINNDHALLLKEDAFATVEHNLFVDTVEAVIQFNEVGGTAVRGAGRGADLTANIFWNNHSLFKNLVDQPEFKTQLTVAHSLLPNDIIDFGESPVMAHDLGSDNFYDDPMFVAPAESNYQLMPESPANGTGPGGLDLGPYVPGGPTLITLASNLGAVEIQVDGPGITDYRYRVGDEPFGPLTSAEETILLDAEAAAQTISVVAKNSAGEWFTQQSASFSERTLQVISPRRMRPGETLPLVARALNWQGNIDTSFQGIANLSSNEFAPTNLLFHHGVATQSATTLAVDDFEFFIEGMPQPIQIDVITTADEMSVETINHDISTDTVWMSDVEYQIEQSIRVLPDATLTIEPGTRIEFATDANLIVNGTLQSLGSIDDPILFSPQLETWGGITFSGSSSDNRLAYTFLTGGGGDASRQFGHSNSQPVILSAQSTVTCDHCFVIDNVGKAFGAADGAITIQDSVISEVDTGGEFVRSIADISGTWLINIPHNSHGFVDDDNDGFYFSGLHSSGNASNFRNSFIYHTKDDGLDHNGARLNVSGAWIEAADHEGLAASNRRSAHVHDSVLIGNNQGVEAGYGGPQVSVTQSVLVRNQNRTDPNSRITSGLRFGDGYDGRNGNYTGHIAAAYLVLHDNGDNIRNYDGTLPGPQDGAIDIRDSLTNDPDENAPSNRNGIPIFGPWMHLLRGAVGFDAGPDGMPLGRPIPTVVWSRPAPSGDFNEDGQRDATDIHLLCQALRVGSDNFTYDLNGDGQVDTEDRNTLILDRIGTTFGDANLDGVFDSEDFVHIFIIGEYQDAIPSNSGWPDGDWNCDQEFTSEDIVLAFQFGGYSTTAVDRTILEIQ